MKKKLLMGFSVIFLLTLLTISTSVSASTSFVGHSFSEDYFAVEVDVRVDDPANPDLIRDLLDASAVTNDSNEWEDKQFFFAYMNKSGIETGFSALEKYEHDLTLGDLVHSDVKSVLNAVYPDELATTIFHINATAPFQQLVQHYDTPWGEDVFVTNNFMTLIAYSSSPSDTRMDAGDDLYLGYTFAVSELTKAVNDELLTNSSTSYQIGNFGYEPSFEPTADGYKFGINYTNMFVLWQPINVTLGGIDILGKRATAAPAGIVFGKDIVAASVLDYIAFEYEFTTTNITGIANNYVLGTVETHYNIGETNFLIVREDTIPAGGNFNSGPFVSAPTYSFDMPSTLAGKTITGLGTIPSTVNIDLPNLAFYAGDDAKKRLNMTNGFGITVATATTTVGISSPRHDDHTDNATSPTVDIAASGNTFFFTDFTGKYSYHLLGLDKAPWNIDPTLERPVEIYVFDPSGWAIHNVAKSYFEVEFKLAYVFTRWFASELEPTLPMPGDGGGYMSRVRYFTFTEFPEWYGGEIIHDPTYSAVAAMAATGETTSETPGPGDTTTGPIPGFELLSVLLAIPPLVALYRKRR